jgi:hypothetical protein
MLNIPLSRLENTRTAREHLQVFLSDGVFEYPNKQLPNDDTLQWLALTSASTYVVYLDRNVKFLTDSANHD